MNPGLFPSLNLPPYGAQTRHGASGGMEIWDAIRRKWVALTPEEWVRQHFVNMLVRDCGFSVFRIANEKGIRVNGGIRRCDTIIYNDVLRPVVIVEYKAPHVPVTQAVFDQIGRYNIVVGAPLLVVTNGLRTFVAHFRRSEVEGEAPQVTFLDGLPTAAQVAQMTSI